MGKRSAGAPTSWGSSRTSGDNPAGRRCAGRTDEWTQARRHVGLEVLNKAPGAAEQVIIVQVEPPRDPVEVADTWAQLLIRAQRPARPLPPAHPRWSYTSRYQPSAAADPIGQRPALDDTNHWPPSGAGLS